jgi:tRNA pseudouridine13 synthase
MSDRWPRGHAAARDRAIMKSRPEDFRVVEIPGFAPAGSGEHLLLRLEKTGLSSQTVAAELARAFGVPEVAVGYAGMKDRHAVTEQWFSVHTARGADALPPIGGVRLLEATRHLRKLRRGELEGNRFVIVLRGVSGQAWSSRLAEIGAAGIGAAGVPNYFGPQRFGSDNLARALAWLPLRRRRRESAFRAGLHLSVLRSFLFNEALAARVRDGSWARLIPGDVPVALCDAADDGAPQVRQVPSGPLWGRGRPPACDAALAVETAALEPHREIREGLEHAGLVQERRSLVLRPWGLSWESANDTVTLAFALPPGCYATVLLGEVFDLRDGAGRDAAG